MGFLIPLLVVVLVASVMYWAIHRIGATFGLAPQIMVVIDVVLVLLVIIYILQLAGFAPWTQSRPFRP